MATEEETYRLIIQFENEEKLKTVAASAALAEQKFKALYDQLGAGNQKTKAAAAALSDLNGQVKALGSSVRGSSGATQGLTQLGYTLDDLQYGFKGIANNIQPLLSTIPQLARFAPGIAIAATAAYQLYEHWGQLAALFGQSVVKTQAEEMDELAKKTAKTADEAERLNRAENLKATTEALQKGKPRAQKEGDAAVRAAVDEAGFGAVIGGLRANAPQLVNDQGEALKAREKLEDLLFGGVGNRHKPGTGATFNNSLQEPQVQAEKLRLEKELADARDRTAQGKVAQAANSGDWGNVPLDQLIAAVEKDTSKFGGKKKGDELLRSLREAAKTPQDRADQKKQEGFDALTSKADADARKRAFDKDEEGRKAGEAADRKEKAEAKQARDKDIRESTPGLRNRFSPELLNNIARGKDNDPEALAEKISKTLQMGGRSKEEADDISGDIADQLIKGVEGRTRERANEEGLTKEEAAAREAEDDATSARSKAPLPKGAIGDASGFAHTLQMALFNKADPIQQAILDENRKIAKFQEDLLIETRKAKPRQGPAVAAGPA